MDEPFLSGYGSAFTPISQGKSDRAFKLIPFEEISSRCRAVIGVHCCGNTDWGILVEAGADVINLDSFGYGENLAALPRGREKAL